MAVYGELQPRIHLIVVTLRYAIQEWTICLNMASAAVGLLLSLEIAAQILHCNSFLVPIWPCQMETHKVHLL